MSLKTTLSQKQKLSLTMHMQQSLKILQMDSISLKERIEEELERNPMLEELQNTDSLPIQQHTIDICWSDNDDSIFHYHESDDTSDASYDPFTYIAAPSLSLCDYLLEQLSMMTISHELIPLLEYLIMSLDDNGFLTETPEAISKDHNISVSLVQDALQIIKNMDPAGVGAADYKECLLIQAHRLALSDNVIQILESDDCLTYLSNNQISKIAKTLNINSNTAIMAVQDILSLNPKPGASFGDSENIYTIPDAYINIEGSGFSITIGDPSIPEIQINSEYSHLLAKTSESEVTEYLTACLKQAQSLINGITQRNRTLFLCVSEIVRRQPNYFKHSNGCLVPMTLGDIAESLEMSISTISRTVKNKYIACCHGTVPLHTLFTSKIQTNASDEGTSSQKIQYLIRKFINEENKEKPLSDSDIAKLLSYEGHTIARRTVSKYRSIMNIPPVTQRKLRK